MTDAVTPTAHEKPRKASRLFGRRRGRPLRARKATLMQDLLPQLELAIAEGERLDPAALFAKTKSGLWLEIGFGGGEHLAGQAERNPEVGFIGCEPFVNGIATLLAHVDQRKLNNIRIFPNDARIVLDALPAGALDKCFVLFADPWPKARHEGRRFIGAENIPRLARALKIGGELRLATDDAQLAVWMRDCLQGAAEFTCLHDAITPPVDWIPTRYEQKGIAAGRQPVYFIYRRQ